MMCRFVLSVRRSRVGSPKTLLQRRRRDRIDRSLRIRQNDRNVGARMHVQSQVCRGYKFTLHIILGREVP